MTWALRRQLFFLAVFTILIAALGYWVTYPVFHRPPTCVDNRQNGDEVGVDCGGSCAIACASQVEPIAILWSRSFRVVPGRYNAVAYLENHNPNVVVKKLHYKFRFADKDNLYIGKREGFTYVPSSGKFAVFEPAIDVGNSIPVYTTFEFTEEPVWTQVEADKINQLKVFASDITLESEDTTPKLFATIKNNSLFTIPELSVVAVIYDAAGNAISASRTYLDVLNKESSTNISFTWPEPFVGTPVVKEIIPIFDISLATLR